jgi:hypothetical protein
MDRAFGRLEEFDERSRAFPIRTLIGDRPLRSYKWRCETRLDQGSEGSCVGHGFAHNLAARPVEIAGVTSDLAVKIYKTAQTLDPWPGEAYSGTSVLAGAKSTMQLYPKSFDSYRWCFGLNDVCLTLGYRGVVILGIKWLSGMDRPDAQGIIKARGQLRGGHCLIADGIDVSTRYIRLLNSWGRSYGLEGHCWISFDDLNGLLQDGGEGLVTVKQHKFDL